MPSERLTAVKSKLISIESQWALALASALFSSNVWFGRMLSFSLLACNPRAWILSLLGYVIANVSARVLSKNSFLTQQYPISLNGAYVGLAISAFVAEWLQALSLLALAALTVPTASIVSARILRPWGLKALVMPYVLIIWICQLIANGSSRVVLAANAIGDAPLSMPVWILGFFRSASLVFFQDSVVFGGLVWLGVFALVRKSGHVAVASVLVPQLMAAFLWPSHWGTAAGMFGFCGLILFMANENKLFVAEDRRVLILVVALSGLMEGAALRLFSITPMYALSAPAVLMIWIIEMASETRKATPISETKKTASGSKWI